MGKTEGNGIVYWGRVRKGQHLCPRHQTMFLVHVSTRNWAAFSLNLSKIQINKWTNQRECKYWDIKLCIDNTQNAQFRKKNSRSKKKTPYFLKSNILSWHKEKSTILINGNKVNELTKEHEQSLKDRNKHSTCET